MLGKKTLAAAVIGFSLSSMSLASADQSKWSNELGMREKFASVTLAYSLDQICDFSANEAKVEQLSDYIVAKWWLWRVRTGVTKTIIKKMGEKAWLISAGGRNCGEKSLKTYQNGLKAAKKFPQEAETMFGKQPKSYLNPKPDQEIHFAKYQLGRYGWLLSRKCNPDNIALGPSDDYLKKLLAYRKKLLIVYRPDQLKGLEKATKSMKVWGTHYKCTAKQNNFIEMAFHNMDVEGDYAAPILKPAVSSFAKSNDSTVTFPLPKRKPQKTFTFSLK